MDSTPDDIERAATLRIVEMALPLFSQESWEEVIGFFADDGVLEFPFAPPGRRSRYVGKPDILAYMKPIAGRIKVDEIVYHKLYPMLDPKMVCMEMGVKGHIAASGAAFNQKYVSFFETKAGKLWRYREYWNPVISMDANGGRDAWTSAFGSPEREGAEAP